uniref:Chitin-binding type-2 domain-containing protein n=1 Tax=Glossina brevipalpis TaxID=37001 RepID=A0A1A9WH08_9MUSC
MHFIVIGMLIMQAARLACGTCTFESAFGFILNCNFKKTGLFRVRNLGGLKAHFGLGFSLGDELGFAESLGNLEGDRRRAINYKNGFIPNGVGVLPASAQQPIVQALNDNHVRSRSSLTLSPELKESLVREAKASAVNEKSAKQAKQVQLMTEARPLPLGVPAFRPIPTKPPTIQMAQRRNQIVMDAGHPKLRVNNKIVEQYQYNTNPNHTFHVRNPVISQPVAVPPFQAMPNSVNKITTVLQTAEPVPAPETSHNISPNYMQFEEPKFDLRDITVEELASAANVSVDTIKRAIYVREQEMRAEYRAMLAAKLRQEFMRTSASTTTTTTTSTTTTTARPKVNIYNAASIKKSGEIPTPKVMNAPKEYYPVSYEKNFDDNFKSKVDLPPTSFSCTTQKHFPGLYADTDLGCMVFHVCALTDDGMVRKSFLCPEDTLFDQTILKCNWWFYVDCMASPSVYDSNIPISKSYQLMKSLSYFSKYAQNIKDKEMTNNEREESSRYDTEADIQMLKDVVFNKDFDDTIPVSEESQNDEAQDESRKTSTTIQDEHQHLNES